MQAVLELINTEAVLVQNMPPPLVAIAAAPAETPVGAPAPAEAPAPRLALLDLTGDGVEEHELPPPSPRSCCTLSDVEQEVVEHEGLDTFLEAMFTTPAKKHPRMSSLATSHAPWRV